MRNLLPSAIPPEFAHYPLSVGVKSRHEEGQMPKSLVISVGFPDNRQKSLEGGISL
jgi:hypothetical protein